MIEIEILYEDNHVLVVEKPRNMPVQEDSSEDTDLLNVLKLDIKERYNKPGNVYLALVHRLDRPVGGAIIFAKTSKAASRLSDSLRRQAIKRQYYAVVRGTMDQDKGRLEHKLWKDRKRNEVHVVKPNDKRGKEARLRYEVLGRKNNLTLVRVALETGRSHQIRVQFAAIGHPLYGDQKYGAKVNRHGQQIALWSTEITFPHPTKKEPITVRSYPPLEDPWIHWTSVDYK